MASIHIVNDASDPLGSSDTCHGATGMTILSWTNGRPEDLRGGPWLCLLVRDGQNYYPLRDEWGRETIQENDQIFFISHLANPVQIIIAVVVIVAAALAVFLIQPPSIADQQQPDPVFSIDGRNNQSRLNAPIEDPYGRNKLWPSYIGAPYVVYEGNNDQVLFQHLSLGLGEFDIESVLIEDSLADNFPGVSYTFDDISVFPNNVSTASEVVNLNLLGINEEDYSGAIGGFAVNPPNTTTNNLEIDYSFPNGCYQTNDDGDLKSAKVEVLWEYREIDKDGEPVTAAVWVDLHLLKRSYRTNKTIRQSVSLSVPDGRYEVRCTRLDPAYPDTDGTDKIQWDGVKAYMGDMDQPTGMTTLSIQTRASTNTVKNKVNVLCTRKIPVWDGAVFNLETSRNPIWAMVNILKSDTGAGLTDANLDLDKLKIAADLADTNSETFDWVFEQKSTVWEASKACCFVSRSTPMLEGSRLSAVRDELKNVPTQLFNAENILAGTFKIQRKMFDLDGNDGLNVQYYDQETWRDETVLAKLPAQSGLNPKKFELRGVTDRTQATILGHYLWASEFFNRETFSFTTSQSGFVSTYGDLVKVAHDIVNGQGGIVELIEFSHTLTLSEPPVFGGGTNQITLRTKTGGVYGPFIVEVVPDEPFKVKLVSGVLDETDIPTGDTHENPHYVFGEVDTDGQLCRVVKMQPQGIDNIKLTVVVENDERFQFDDITPPAIVYPPLAPFPELPEAENITMSESAGDMIVVWDAATSPTADDYTISISEDGLLYTDEQTTALLTATFTLPSYADSGVFVQITATNSDGTGLPVVIFGNPSFPNQLVDPNGLPLIDPLGNILVSG